MLLKPHVDPENHRNHQPTSPLPPLLFTNYCEASLWDQKTMSNETTQVIYSMNRVGKIIPPSKQTLRDI